MSVWPPERADRPEPQAVQPIWHIADSDGGRFTTNLRPGPFPTQAASLLPGLLTATRTGLTPASDNEHEPKITPSRGHLPLFRTHGGSRLRLSSVRARNVVRDRRQGPGYASTCPAGIWRTRTAGIGSAWVTSVTSYLVRPSEHIEPVRLGADSLRLLVRPQPECFSTPALCTDEIRTRSVSSWRCDVALGARSGAPPTRVVQCLTSALILRDDVRRRAWSSAVPFLDSYIVLPARW